MLGFTPFAAAPFAAAGSVSVSVDVTGVQATGQVGAVAVTGTATVLLTGVSATGFVGVATVAANADVPVTGFLLPERSEPLLLPALRTFLSQGFKRQVRSAALR